jgi:hypothetical protein
MIFGIRRLAALRASATFNIFFLMQSVLVRQRRPIAAPKLIDSE